MAQDLDMPAPVLDMPVQDLDMPVQDLDMPVQDLDMPAPVLETAARRSTAPISITITMAIRCAANRADPSFNWGIVKVFASWWRASDIGASGILPVERASIDEQLGGGRSDEEVFVRNGFGFGRNARLGGGFAFNGAAPCAGPFRASLQLDRPLCRRPFRLGVEPR
jgi:hypothetical protein